MGALIAASWLAFRTKGELAICPVLVVVVAVPLIITTAVFGVIATIKAGSGKFWKMPVLGDIAELFKDK